MGQVLETPEAGLPARIVARARRRVFSTSPGTRQFRRASDVVLLAPALVALVGLAVAFPPSRLVRALVAFLETFPGWLDPVWGLFYDVLALWAVALVVAALAGRRAAVGLSALLSVAVAAAVAIVSTRLALGHWPDVTDTLRLEVDETTFAVLRVAVGVAMILAVSPHLVRPLQVASRWVVFLGLVGAILVEDAPPTASLAAFLVAVVAATTVRLAVGTSAGHPETADVAAALAELHVPVARLEPTSRQPAGVFVARGEAPDGRPLLVKVYGRDAYDTQLLQKLWRTVLYQGAGRRARVSRLDAVEHEALVTLFARQAGVPTREVVAAAETSFGDALLVFRDDSRPLHCLAPHELDDALLAKAWQVVVALGNARVAHHRIDTETVVVEDGTVGLVDFDVASLAPRPEHLLLDRARLLAATAALVGNERAVAAAVAAVGREGVAALLPYLQSAAFDAGLRRAMKEGRVDGDELRATAAAAVGMEAPALIKLRRVTWMSGVQIALLAFALSSLVGSLMGIDYGTLGTYLGEASWWWLGVGFVCAQLPRVTQAISTLGSVPAPLPFVPVYAMQLTSSYMNLALPSNLARMAISIRFFQRQGVPPASAVTAGTIDSFASTAIQLVLLLSLLLFSEASLDFDLDTPSGPSVRTLAVVAGVAVAGIVAVSSIRRFREPVVEKIRQWWPEIRATLLGLRAGHKLALLVGGSLATEILFATSLGIFANALGFDVGLADLLLVNISVSLLATVLPVPGGIGVAEFGLTLGLTALGMADEAALASVLMYRFSTFYLPPIWGFLAMRWMQRNALL